MFIKSEPDRRNLIIDIVAKPLPFRVDLPSARSLDQNALSHVWYGEISKQCKEFSTDEARRFCKLQFGVPILRSESEPFRERWDRLVKPRFLYAEKLELMAWFPVTSLMGKTQMTQYLEAMQKHWAARGVVLMGLEHGAEQYPEAQA